MPSDTPPLKTSSPGSSPILEKSRPKSSSSAPSPRNRSPTPTNISHGQQFTTSTSSGLTDNPSGSQQFCLRWNNYQTNLTSVFDQLLQNESFVDVTLACDGQSIKAHKMVLSACSPYFQALFFDNPCQHPIIIMRDVKWPELKAAVEFMYRGEINVSQDQIGPLLKVAEMLKIRGLADVNGEPDASPQTTAQATAISSTEIAAKKTRIDRELELSSVEENVTTIRNRKRRWPSSENPNIESPLSITGGCVTGSGGGGGGASGGTNASTPTPERSEIASPVAVTNTSQMSHPPPSTSTLPPFPIPTPLESMGLPSLGMSHADDMEIKPGIAEMIREEERVSTF